MGLWDKLFGTPDPSSNWKAEPDFPIVLDMTRHALCGVRLGDPVEWLSKLGPPEEKKAIKEGCYRYPSKGIDIGAEGGNVTDYTIAWIPDFCRPDFTSFSGSALFRDRSLPLTSSTSEEDFVKTFGQPYWRAEDDIEIILFYEFKNNIEWQVEFSREHLLKTLLMVTPPLMSFQDQRSAYGVTGPWPPEYR